MSSTQIQDSNESPTPEAAREIRNLPTEPLLPIPSAAGAAPGNETLLRDRASFARDTAVTSPSRAGGDPRDEEGAPFGRYRLLGELGHGGMGIVWRAWDTLLKRTVALKQILPEKCGADFPVERFVREAQIAAKLKHPGIVGVLDVGVLDGRHYFTTDYVEGRSLAALLDRAADRREIAAWIAAVAEALNYAHEQGIVHRDVKPENILIDGRGRAFVTDFGLAREVDLAGEAGAMSRLTASGALVGTPRYMSPEQASGRRDALGPAADQFALGVVLYELLTGKPPFAAESLRDLLNAIAEAEPARPRSLRPEIEPDLETVCRKALEKDPAHRYPSLGEMAADLTRYLEGEPIRVRASSVAVRMSRAVARHRAAVIGVVAAFALVAMLGGWGLFAWLRLRETDAARERTRQDQAEALRLIEQGRPALDRAEHTLYDAGSDPAELARRVDAGKRLIEQALQKAPEMALGHYLLGIAWDLEGWDDQAEACWRKAIVLDPGFGPAHYRLGRLLVMRSFLAVIGVEVRDTDSRARMRGAEPVAAEAAREFAAAFRGELGPAFADEERRWKETAQALQAMMAGDRNEVHRICTEALRRAPQAEGSEEFCWLIGLSLEAGRPRMEWYERALSICPKFAAALFCRASDREVDGDLRGSLLDYDALLAVRPRMVAAWNNRGSLRLELRRFAEARADFTQALQIAPGYAPALAGRGSCRMEEGDIAGAIADFSAAIESDPRLHGAFNNRANAHYRRGETVAARADWDAALRIDPRYLPAVGNRGTCDLERGEPEGAIEDLRTMLRLAPAAWPDRAEAERRLAWAWEMSAARDLEGHPRWSLALQGAYRARLLRDYGAARTICEEALVSAGAAADRFAPARKWVLEACCFLAAASAQASIGEFPPGSKEAVGAEEATRRRERAFAWLTKALASDPSRARERMANLDLTPLHADPRWQDLESRFGK